MTSIKDDDFSRIAASVFFVLREIVKPQTEAWVLRQIRTKTAASSVPALRTAESAARCISDALAFLSGEGCSIQPQFTSQGSLEAWRWVGIPVITSHQPVWAVHMGRVGQFWTGPVFGDLSPSHSVQLHPFGRSGAHSTRCRNIIGPAVAGESEIVWRQYVLRGDVSRAQAAVRDCERKLTDFVALHAPEEPKQ